MNTEHRRTLEMITGHRGTRNVEWHRVRSLLEAVGTVRDEHNGKLEVTVGRERLVFQPPHGKDVDEQTLVDIRRLLERAGYDAAETNT